MASAALFSVLPKPIHNPLISDYNDSDDEVDEPSVSALSIKSSLPAYGHRRGWKPTSQDHFADGGAYPECHVAQYPLDMGRKKASSGNTLALQVDADGNVRYDAIAHQGHCDGRNVQSQFKDLVPLAQRTDLDDNDRDMERPSEEEVQNTAERTKAALEKLVGAKIKAAQPKNVPDTKGKTSFLRYTPGQQNPSQGNGMQQRIIKMSEVIEDPLEPPRFKHKKIPRGPPSPPAPVLRSPPRKATAQEQKDWMIPPCISNWKNNKGFTIPLDKRLAADGRGLQDVHINDNFAKFSEALFVADRHAREEVRERSLMQQRLDSAEDEEARKVRDQMRSEKRREREREMRMNNMGTEQRAKMLARQENRDISEKIALGLAKPTASKESMLDSRLFNRESLPNSFASEDAYNLYDKPLFHGSTAAAAIYKARGNMDAGDDAKFAGGTEDGINKALANDRFQLGASGFSGAEEQEVREGPVQFEKDTTGLGAGGQDGADLFGVGKFLDEAKRGTKRGLDTGAGGSRKRQQLDKSGD
ncbi:pre-mRNA-processing protein 45 [Clavulina sp. PMI_390]|nr:pre-mRNA-processing protein 45 [Clavulina sp. PMI_390]